MAGPQQRLDPLNAHQVGLPRGHGNEQPAYAGLQRPRRMGAHYQREAIAQRPEKSGLGKQEQQPAVGNDSAVIQRGLPSHNDMRVRGTNR